MSGLAALKAGSATELCSVQGERVGSMRKPAVPAQRRGSEVKRGRGGGQLLRPVGLYWCCFARVAAKATPAQATRLHKPLLAADEHPFYSRPTLRKYPREKRPLKG